MVEWTNGNGLSFRGDDITVRRNISALNRKYQFGLWSDNVFFGPHPSAKVGTRGTPYDPARANIRLDHNLYWSEPDQGLFLWGVPWRPKHTVYTN